MKNFFPVYKKELQSYFYSPIAYVIIVVFLLLAGYLFYSITNFYYLMSQFYETSKYQATMQNLDLNVRERVFRPLLGNFSIAILVLMPLLTMRLFSEEKKTKTIELLFTYPLKDEDIILGKFMASFTIYMAMLIPTLLYPVLLSFFTKMEWGSLMVGYLGLVLSGAAFLAIGIFFSAITENQIVSAVLCFGVLLLFLLFRWAKEVVSWWIGEILTYLSFMSHSESFTKGLLNAQDVVFYLTFMFFFLFLTYSLLSSKKWRG